MKKKQNPVRERGGSLPAGMKKMWGDRVFDMVNAVLMVFICLVIAYPLYYVLLASFTDPTIVNSGKILLYPEKLFLGGYKKIFQYRPIWTGYANTLIYTFGGTAAAIAATVPCAFALSRKALWGRRVLNFLFTFTMFFSGGLIPTYILIKNLGLIDSLFALIFPVAINTWNLIILRTTISGLPESLVESARIDGANDFVILWKLIVPLVKPTLAVLVLYYVVGHWNSWFNAMLYIKDRDKFPLQLILREILIANTSNAASSMGLDLSEMDKYKQLVKYCTTVIATLPILCVYPFLQKYFVKGVMIGAVKG